MTAAATSNVTVLQPRGRVGAPLYRDQWSNAKCVRIASMAAAGYTAKSIASRMADGTTANDVTAMLSDWGLKQKGSRHSYAAVPVELTGMHRTRLADEAQRRGMEMPELLAKITATICRDELFDAVLDG